MQTPAHPSPIHSLTRRQALATGLGLAASALVLPAAAAAPRAPGGEGSQGRGFYRFRVGEAEVYLLSDGFFEMPARPSFTGDATVEDAEAQLRAAFWPAGRPALLDVQALLVRLGGRTFLVDTGNLPGGAPSTGRLAEHLGHAGFGPADIDGVILTHLHSDHAGGLEDPGLSRLIGDAPVLVTAPERRHWAEDSRVSARARATTVARQAIATAGARLAEVALDERVAPGITLVPAVGHTPGHVAVRVESAGETLLFISDCVHFAPLQLPRPEWSSAFDVDRVAAVATRRALLDQVVAERLLITGSHLPFPGLCHLRRSEGGYLAVPAPWRW